jgi:hypothetical protein
MKAVNLLGAISGSLTVITFIDGYFLQSKIMKNLAIPDSIPTSIFIIVLATGCFIFFVLSRKAITLPYPDQREEVLGLNNQKQLHEKTISDLIKQNEEFLPIKTMIDSNDYLQDQIHGVLLRGSISSNNLLRELKIDPNNKVAVSNIYAVIGQMAKQGKISTTSLGEYRLP